MEGQRGNTVRSNVLSWHRRSLFPFTGEANVNISMPHTSIPFTACHEMAHQIGFAREDEANFIAYIACKNHPSPDFQYSGILSALINATNTYTATTGTSILN